MNESTRRVIFWAGYEAGFDDAMVFCPLGGGDEPRPQMDRVEVEASWRAFIADAMAKFEASARGEQVELDPPLVARDGAVVIVVRGDVAPESMRGLLRNLEHMHEVTGLYGVALAGNADAKLDVSAASEDEMRAQGWIRTDKAREEVDRQQVGALLDEVTR